MPRVILTISGKEGNGGTVRSGTAGTTNTMDIILRVIGVIVVEHMGDVAHIFIATEVSRRRRVCIATFQRGSMKVDG